MIETAVVRTTVIPWFSTNKFELKTLANSNRTSVFEHLGWKAKKAEWSRNTLHAQSRRNE